MSERVCRWGIMGTATIARKNWQAIRNAGNAVLTAVASRSVERSRQYIDECQASVSFPETPRACGRYDELLSSQDIDAVYIPLPTGIRKEWVIRAAEAGKHVLVEKPVGCNSAEVAEMIAACRRNNVQFMDGVMFMHSGRLGRMRESLNDGQSVGRLRRITSQFSFKAGDDFLHNNIRVSGELEPLGCLGDLGWYNIRFTLWVLNYQMPSRVTGRLLSEAKRPDSRVTVPTEFSAELFFPDGVSASFYCSFVAENQQWASISGTEGLLNVPDFVLPFYGSEAAFTVTKPKFRVNGCQFNMEEHTRRVAVEEYSNNAGNSQETQLFRNFSKLALSGQPDHSWGDIALKTQQVMDACLASARQDGKPVELPV
ncbi:MAG: Gfo/Idh/MocA family oxidoreductase [Planctomycetales bacterium]|nr:Gfo/Idh/MocA family oxidoreductase [Planctomycetales bacterium]